MLLRQSVIRRAKTAHATVQPEHLITTPPNHVEVMGDLQNGPSLLPTKLQEKMLKAFIRGHIKTSLRLIKDK